MKDWRSLTGKRVHVRASGISYRGVLVELGELAVVLRCEGGFQEIPWERITHMGEDPEAGPGTGGDARPGRR